MSTRTHTFDELLGDLARIRGLHPSAYIGEEELESEFDFEDGKPVLLMCIRCRQPITDGTACMRHGDET